MPLLGEIAAIFTAVMWSITSVAFTEASVRVGSLTVNVTRLIIATFFLLITVLVLGFKFDLTNSQFLYMALSGIIGLVFGDGFLFKGFQYVGARISMLVMSLVPAFSAFLAFFILGEIISFWGIVGILLTMSGVMLVVLQKNNSKTFDPSFKIRGLIYCLLGALGQAAGLIFAKFAFNEGSINGFVATLVRIIPSIIFLYPIAYFSNRLGNPIKTYLADRKAFKFTLLGTFVGPYLGITFSLIAIANTYVGIASTLMSTAPIIMLPLVKYYYKEKLSAIAIIGTFIAVAGIAILFVD